jgi:hypothetical protein
MRRALTQVRMVALLIILPSAIEIPQTSPAQPSAQKETQTTIVGCLVQGIPAEVASDRRSDAGAVNANDYFVRTPAMMVPVGGTVVLGDPKSAAGTGTGRATTSAGDATATAFYRITGLNRDQLRPHVGHRVELQGHLSGPDGRPGPASPRGTTARTTVDATGRAKTTVESKMEIAGVLHATALKMVDASCK